MPYGILSGEWVNNIVYTKEQLYCRPQVEKRASVSQYMSVHMCLIMTLAAAVLANYSPRTCVYVNLNMISDLNHYTEKHCVC